MITWSALNPASRRAAAYGLLVRMARPRGACGVSINASSALNPLVRPSCQARVVSPEMLSCQPNPAARGDPA